MADDSDDDELFKFATSKQNLHGDKDLDYYEDLLKDAEENDGGECSEILRAGSRRKRTTKGLAEDIMAGIVEKRMRTASGEKDDIVVLTEDGDDGLTKTIQNDSSPEWQFDSPSPPSNYSPDSYKVTPGYTPLSADDYEARRLMDSIDTALYSLRRGNYNITDSEPFDQDSFTTTTDTTFNLRVRCRGKIHTFQIREDEPFSTVFTKLSNIHDDSNVLLQLKSAEVKSSDTVITLGLSTVDILDAFVIDKTEETVVSNDKGNINIKIQTSKKSVTYSVNNNEPLARVMKDFAGQLNVELYKVKFTFDGEVITGSSSAQSLDMEDDDVIDAVV